MELKDDDLVLLDCKLLEGRNIIVDATVST